MKKEDWKENPLWQEGQRRAKKRMKCQACLAGGIGFIILLGIVLTSLLFNINPTTAVLGGGLICNIFGAAYLVTSAIPTNQTAYNMSTTRYNGNTDLLAAILANKQAAKIGLVFIFVGFLVQVGRLL